MSDWWQYDSGPRRPAPDGVRARSQQGPIGESWWSRRFLDALAQVADTSRLGRGRSYARSGQVMRPLVQPGLVTALVQGSRPTPYEVRITLRPFTDAEWERAEGELAAQALFLAALLAGEMPRDVEQAFAAVGLSLFPASPAELASSCTCPDHANPCKHTAAVYYILAEAFDADPFLVLAWRGRPRETLLERLRELRAAAIAAEDAAAPADVPAQDVEPAPSGDPVAEAPRTGGFWTAGPELFGFRYAPAAPAVPDAVIRQLGPLPEAAGGSAVAGALTTAYGIFTAA
ncbi:MAG TPA: SWIM zinc finger family protein, partial [Longimicrobiaceae bacterium]|nr:SWIM zinc finger family protein [Longimicrobiaceae bacterium]